MKTTVWHATTTSKVNGHDGRVLYSRSLSLIIILLFSDIIYIIPAGSPGRIIMRSSASDSSVQRVHCTHIILYTRVYIYNCITSIILYYIWGRCCVVGILTKSQALYLREIQFASSPSHGRPFYVYLALANTPTPIPLPTYTHTSQDWHEAV